MLHIPQGLSVIILVTGEVKYKAESSGGNLKAVSAFDFPEPLILWAKDSGQGQAAASASIVCKWM